MNSETSKFNFSGDMTAVDSLIEKAQDYVRQYLSETDSKRLMESYKKKEYNEVKNLLKKAMRAIKCNLKPAEKIAAKNIIERVFKELDNITEVKGSEEYMENTISGSEEYVGNTISGGVIAFIIIILAIAVIAGLLYNQSKKNRRYPGMPQRKKTKSPDRIVYTEKDRDMIKLIHDLSEVYQKTDEYLKN